MPQTALQTKLQRQYYTETAGHYDEFRAGDDRRHEVALAYASSIARTLNVESILEVGCGTGNSLRFLQEQNPRHLTVGIEPVRALLDVAVDKGIDPSTLIQADGAILPFKDDAFDAVVETGVFHHVKDPNPVVREMMRVARKAIFVSDNNIFGQSGSRLVNALKLALYKGGLWRVVKFVQDKGRGYYWSEGDGVSYSYSVYFHYRTLARWSSRIIAIPTGMHRANGLTWSPILSSETMLLCAIKDESDV